MRTFVRIMIIFSVGIALSACEKYLETAPDQRAVLDSPEKVSELLTSAYPQANYFPFAEAMSDNVGDKGAGVGVLTFMNLDPWTFSDVRSRSQDTPDYYWYACYRAIAAANRALKHISTVHDPDNYSSQKGEALVARAYAHFMLVTFFANVYDPNTAATDPGIPYVTEPEENLLVKYERKTVAYVYQQIENDLMEGLPLLQDARYKSPKYHFTRSAAHAFAARFYLFRRSYDEVVEHASQVVPNGDFNGFLRPINKPEYRAMEYFNKQADYTAADNPANILLVEAVSQWGGTFPSLRYGLTNEILVDLFFSGNPTGGEYAYMLYGDETSYNIPKFKGHFVQSGVNANFGLMYNMVPLFSAEEVLLNRAEALAMQGSYEDAIADLNVFAQAKVFFSQNNPVYDPILHKITAGKLIEHYANPELRFCIVQAVLDFKRMEYLFEGMRYLDILRHHIPVVHRSKDNTEVYTLAPNDPRRLLQLPSEVRMSGVESNPR